MKKTLFSCIALFTLGQAAMAQTLPPGSALNPEKSTNDATQKAAPAKADADAMGYWVDARSYYESSGKFNPDGGAYYSFRANLSLDGTRVTMKDLVDLNGLELTSSEEIEGVYDANAKTITVTTAPYSDEGYYTDYTRYGEMTYYGASCAVVLFSGDFITTSTGQSGLETKEQLVFDVSDDLTTLTPRSGFGLWAFDKSDGSVVGCLNYYQGSTVAIEKMPDEAKLAFVPSAIHFEGANVTVGATVKQTVKLVNKGLKATDYSGYADGTGLQMAAYRNIEAATVQEVYAQLIPAKSGDFSGAVYVNASNGSTATLKVTAKVGEAPDYSQIVKEGDITFSIGSDYPFAVTDTITGFPVAVSTNKGNNTSSTLFANFVVPEGKVGVFSWKGLKRGGYSNGFNIQNNEEFIFDDTYSHGMDVSSFTDDLSNTLALPAGYYVVRFQNFTNMDFTGNGDVTLRGYLYDMSLRLFDQKERLAVLKSDALDFGEHFYDRLSVRDTLTATVINIGSEPLQVSSIDGQGAFSGVTPGAEAGFCEELPVQIVFESDQLGMQNGTISINTNAGTYSLNCAASNVAIPVDYHSIVSEGDFSFNTSANYPFAVKDGKAYNTTAKKKTNDDLSSFLEAYFEVPEGQNGKLAWTAHNSSLDWFIFMNDTTMTTGTMITLDGGNAKEFAGEDVDASSTNYEPEELVFAPGRHVVRFYYRKLDSSPKFDDRVDISNLSITYTDAVEGITATGREAIAEEYYTLDGRRIQQPQRGITLVKTRYADGSTRTVKVLR